MLMRLQRTRAYQESNFKGEDTTCLQHFLVVLFPPQSSHPDWYGLEPHKARDLFSLLTVRQCARSSTHLGTMCKPIENAQQLFMSYLKALNCLSDCSASESQETLYSLKLYLCLSDQQITWPPGSKTTNMSLYKIALAQASICKQSGLEAFFS